MPTKTTTKSKAEKQPKSLWLVMENDGWNNSPVVKKISDLADMNVEDIYETKEDAVSNFDFDEGNYLVEINIKSVETDKVIDEKLRVIKLS